MNKKAIWILVSLAIILLAIILYFVFGDLSDKPDIVKELDIYDNPSVTLKLIDRSGFDGVGSRPVLNSEVLSVDLDSRFLKVGDVLSLSVSGNEDLGCKDADGDGGVTIPTECANLDKPEMIYGGWTSFNLIEGDNFSAQIKCISLLNDVCDYWVVSDDEILID